VLQAAKKPARREKKTTGEVISELARRALTRGGLVTNELIDTLREDDAY